MHYLLLLKKSYINLIIFFICQSSISPFLFSLNVLNETEIKTKKNYIDIFFRKPNKNAKRQQND